MKRSPLDVGAKSRERGSTFSAEPSPLKREAPLRPSEMDRQAWGRPRNSMGASPAQVAKRRQLGACIVTGDTQGVDAAHLWDRSMGGCNSKDCIVPLRRDIHELYDRHEFDLLPYLLAAGCLVELQHALEHARGDLVGLLNRLTGERWVPERAAAA